MAKYASILDFNINEDSSYELNQIKNMLLDHDQKLLSFDMIRNKVSLLENNF